MVVSKEVYNAIFNVLIGVIMSAMMSFIMTVVNVGIIDGFMGIWIKSLLLGCAVAIPITFIAIPMVGKMLSFIEIKQD